MVFIMYTKTEDYLVIFIPQYGTIYVLHSSKMSKNVSVAKQTVSFNIPI